MLSANTFTFLVLLSHKKGGMSGGLSPVTKTNISESLQSLMSHPALPGSPPPTCPPAHTSFATAPQCRSTVLRLESHQMHSQFLASSSPSFTRVFLQQEAPHY
ncbi:hypothetical protein ILYODFUR_020187 [Ilyodon furcidens]|uniref:Uncharacterized protein n=2 Tax=Goodeidae TaxID=28758 RepID=A0ABV0SNG4_9TELE